jgi:hypothetical protein
LITRIRILFIIKKKSNLRILTTAVIIRDSSQPVISVEQSRQRKQGKKPIYAGNERKYGKPKAISHKGDRNKDKRLRSKKG